MDKIMGKTRHNEGCAETIRDKSRDSNRDKRRTVRGYDSIM